MTKARVSGPGTSPRTAADQPYHHGNLRSAILEAALNALRSKEPSQLSLRDLARSVGVGHSALYAHFRDRDELLAIIARQGFQALSAAMRECLGDPGTVDRLGALADAYLRFARSNPAYYRAMFLAQNIRPENIGHIKNICEDCLQILIDTLAECRDISQADALDRAVGIWSTLHGVALLGGESGPLQQTISSDREPLLARKFVEVLAGGSW